MQVSPSRLQKLIHQERRNLARSGKSTSHRLEAMQAAWLSWLLHMDQIGQIVRIPNVNGKERY